MCVHIVNSLNALPLLKVHEENVTELLGSEMYLQLLRMVCSKSNQLTVHIANSLNALPLLKVREENVTELLGSEIYLQCSK